MQGKKKDFLVKARNKIEIAFHSFVKTKKGKRKRRKTRKIIWYKVRQKKSQIYATFEFRFSHNPKDKRTVEIIFCPRGGERLTHQSLVTKERSSRDISFLCYPTMTADSVVKSVRAYLAALDKGVYAEHLFAQDARLLGWEVIKTGRERDISGIDFDLKRNGHTFGVDVKFSEEFAHDFMKRNPGKFAIGYPVSNLRRLQSELDRIVSKIQNKKAV